MSNNSNSEEVPWSDLPSTIVTKIFSHLPQNDRVNASIVCRNWQTAFHLPELWTFAIIRFEGKLSSPSEVLAKFCRGPIFKNRVFLNFSNEKAIIFADCSGRYLKDLWFKVYLGTHEMMEDECCNLMSLIEQFFKKMAEKECVLQKVQIDCDLFSRNWKPEVRETFIEQCTQFLHSQKHLKIAKFECWWKQCLRLMESLIAGSGSSLQSLKFNLEVEDIPLEETTQEPYYSLFAKLPNLEILEMPSECINRLVFSNLLMNNSAFKSIKLDCGSTPLELLLPPKIGIPSSQWRMAAEKHPGLQIKLCVCSPIELGSLCFMISFSLSSSSLLLFKLALDVYINTSRREVHNERLFYYLTNIFSEAIESFSYSDFRPTAMEVSTPHIKQFLLNCPRIRDLNLFIYKDEPISYIEDICIMQVENKIEIRNLYIEYCSGNADDQITLSNIYELYKEQLGNRNWKFHFIKKS